MTKAEKVVAFAESQVGMGYVWGANGQTLTPSTLAQLKKQSPEHVDESIVSKWMGRNVYDCASFITHCMKQANIKMTTAGVSSQWKKTNWAEKGTIGTLPRNKVCCLYREEKKVDADFESEKKEEDDFGDEKKAEEEKLLEEYGGEEGYKAHIKQVMEDREKQLAEMFGDDLAAKIAYLQGKNTEK